ncbi:MAG: glutamate--cysteine ligase [Gammaproteobacteria bacterium]|nr:glutamate--cysteine ligase [Gammaproteobacteria bacterium]
MGDEIRTDQFSESDTKRFRQALERETELLGRWFRDGRFDDQTYQVGFELETWLIDLDCHPLPHNDVYLERYNNPLCLPELSRFNIEFNTPHTQVGSGMLSLLHQQLDESWQQATEVAESMDMRLGMIGILPTVQESDLTVDSMSQLKRYRALNERVMDLRKNRPLQIDIRGRDHLFSLHEDVMLESACTSFQVHLQVPQSRTVAAYNASMALSATTVAMSCNAPFLFGRDLWDETRVPLFEQSVSLSTFAGQAQQRIGRVGCGSGSARESLFEFFEENLNVFPVILPQPFQSKDEQFMHLKLHNGTIWRWNRPLIGSEDGVPHLRIEHRVMPSGPTGIDMIANVAFWVGAMMAALEGGEGAVLDIPFATARENFYRAACTGLDTKIVWSDGAEHPISELILETLLPMARRGLKTSGLDESESDRYLDIIEARVEKRRTGARWMRAWRYSHDGNMQALVGAYLTRQQSGVPVHEWPL